MKSCFMFGHGNTPDSSISNIEAAIEDHYLQFGTRVFYVGNRGRFDALAALAARRIKQRHEDMQLILLLAYHPGERAVDLTAEFDNSYDPPLEGVPRQYAIVRANKHMIDTADSIICYVKHIGNTRSLLEYAQRRQRKDGIIIDNVAEGS